MSSIRPQLLETANSLLSDGGSHQGFVEAGFGLLLVTEADGGIGGDWGDAVAVLQSVGYHAPGLDVRSLIISPASGDPLEDGALATAALISGALQKTMELSIDHANVRAQFGKPLSKQQAVQQSLAALAEETAAIAVAVGAAALVRDNAEAVLEIASTKLRANRAAGIGAAIAHQVHGAIGFTRDHPLHLSTAALAQWRSAFGSDAYWSARLGEIVVSLGGRGLWEQLTDRGNRPSE